jgi:hypothetical protein
MRRSILKVIFTAIVVSMLLLQCGVVGPCATSSIQGRVLDPSAESPLADVQVFVTYFYTTCFLSWNSWEPVATQWATTNEQGEFSIPARLLLKIPACGLIDRHPRFYAFHKEVGLQSSKVKSTRKSDPLVLMFSTDRLSYKHLQGSSDCSSLSTSACRHYCSLTHRLPCPK